MCLKNRCFYFAAMFALLFLSLINEKCFADNTNLPWHIQDKAVGQMGVSWAFKLAYSPDDKYLAVATKVGIKIIDARTHDSICFLFGHKGAVQSIVFGPDSKLFASGSLDGTVRIWEIPSGKELKVLLTNSQTVTSVAFSPDYKLLASSGTYDNNITIWDVNTWTEVKSLS